MRRNAYRQVKKVVPGTTWDQFAKPIEGSSVMPRFLYWSGKQYPVKAHVYTHCPVLFKEWAGVGHKQPVFAPFSKARTRTESVCGLCWMQYKEGRELA